MGENEQGGMLRTVIVLGLISLIAAVAVALVVGLKGDMKNRVQDALPPDMIFTAGNSTTDYNTAANVVAYDKAYAKAMPDGTIVLDTPPSSSPTPYWAHYNSEWHSIPNNVTKIKYTVTATISKDSQYVNAWIQYLNDKGFEVGASNPNYISMPVDGNEHTLSKELTIPKDAVKYRISLQSRENSHVVYKSATVKFLD